jgi:hypothetical protein
MRGIRSLRDRVVDVEIEAVRDALAAGLSWAAIGSALGIDEEAAVRRWANLETTKPGRA